MTSETMNEPHDWQPSRLGHGEAMCVKCYSTNREAAVLGILNNCPNDAARNKAPA